MTKLSDDIESKACDTEREENGDREDRNTLQNRTESILC